MLTITEKTIAIKNKEKVKEGLGDYLDTYVRQYNQMVETFEWMKDKLDFQRSEEWKRTIDSLKKICQALDAGFDPTTPPKNWASGLLVQYIAPIPKNVRDSIEKAEPIFGRQQILIYDPNEEHFQRPKNYDPLAIGFINLADKRHHFLIGAWDLEADLKFIEVKPSRGKLPMKESSENIDNLLQNVKITYTDWSKPNITTDKWIYTTPYTTSGTAYGNLTATVTNSMGDVTSMIVNPPNQDEVNIYKTSSSPTSKWSNYMLGK